MFGLRKLFFRRDEILSDAEVGSNDIIYALLSDLKHQLKGYTVHYELNSKLKLFQKYSGKKKQKLFPGLYLELEDFLLLQPEYSSKTKSDFREALLMEYPSIRDYPDLYVVFLDYEIQKVALSRIFLKDALRNAKELLGNFQDPFISDAETTLETPFDIDIHNTQMEINAKQNNLYEYSTNLQAKIQDSLGKNAMLSIFNKTYHQHYNNYYLLQSFTTTVNLIPEDLLVMEDTNMPSKGQMHRLLKTQITSLEEINSKLSREIIDRKNVERELGRNERLYSAVLHNSLNANIIFNRDGSIIRWNVIAQELFDDGSNLYQLIPSVFNKELIARINNPSLKIIKQLATDSFDFRITRNKETSYYSLKTSPIFVDDEILFFCVINDITKEETTRKLIEEAKDLAEKSALAKTTFLSNMSHEIRTPLNVILGLAELFNKDNFTGSEREFENIEIIKFSAENLLTLVNDILDFSKINAGKMNIQHVDFNLFEVIENLTAGFTHKAREKGLNYVTELDETAPKFVKGDQFRLSQILNNLLSNAIKFTSKGHVSLSVKVKQQLKDRVDLTFEVKDTGIGISKENQVEIFESFYQTIDEKGEKPLGTGLGLSITKQLVALLGGELYMNSTMGKGTVFGFEINYPLSNLNSDAIVSSDMNKDAAHLALRGKHILVAEDNKLNQLFITQLLNQWEAHVTIANNGFEAIDAVKKDTFDLILMDVHMPIVNGLEATKEIRRFADSTKDTPIVACSADVFPESRRQAEEAGVDFYITKPVNKESIKEILFLLTK
ncbi:MAG: ATP-binding protein [Bacteroidota bacterium]